MRRVNDATVAREYPHLFFHHHQPPPHTVMPPRAGTRSQRPPTQTQSRSQRPRQSQANHDDDSEGDDHNMDPGDNEEAGVDVSYPGIILRIYGSLL